jgi:ABC-type sulfate transport system permease component
MEFTDTFPVYVYTTGQSSGQPAAALSIISLGLTWAAMLAILFVSRGPNRREVQLGGVH